MKRVAFVFSSAPHGSAAGREGLDALLATSALTDEIGVFFVGDGVFQLLPAQRPGAVLARDYIATFKLLSLYDIDQCWPVSYTHLARCCRSLLARRRSGTPVFASR